MLGTPVEIDGSSFGDTQGSSAVTLNGTSITVTSWSAWTISEPFQWRPPAMSS